MARNIIKAVAGIICSLTIASCGDWIALDGEDGGRDVPVDPTKGAIFENFQITGSGSATLDECETKNGVRTGKVTTLEGAFSFEFRAGEEIIKISANRPELLGNVLSISESITSMSYALDGESFKDAWTTKVPAEVVFTATDGSKVTRQLNNWTLTSLSFTETNNVWSNKALLSVAGVPQATDTQIITINSVIDWEPADEAAVTGRNESSLEVFETENGIRTGKTAIVKANYAASLTAGPEIVKTSKDVIVLSNTVATIAGSAASFTYTLGSASFQDAWAWSAQTSATFTMPNDKEVTRPIKAEYSVRSTSFTSNNNYYRNAASLYAGGIIVAEDAQLLKVEEPAAPFIPGYEAYNTTQWAVTRVYDRNANRNLVVWVYTLKNMSTGAIVAGHMVLEGTAATAELPQQLQSVSAPSFTTPYSLCYNVRTSAWEYGTLRGAKKGQVNETWAYANWSNSNNQPMSVNISIDVADDIVWLEDNLTDQDGIVTIVYNGKRYTIVSDRR